MKPIIYLAQCKLDHKKLYVGQSVQTLEERKHQHIQQAMRGDPADFHRALLEEGVKHWNWRVLEECDADNLDDREKHWIKEFNQPDVKILNGRYGPYISFQKKNYRIPKTKDPKSLTLQDCLDLVEKSSKSKQNNGPKKSKKKS